MLHRFFYQFVSALILIASVQKTYAQETQELQATGKLFMQQGDYDNSTLVLNKALEKEPNNISVLRDLTLSYLALNNYTKAVEVSKRMVANNEADYQSFQLLAQSYSGLRDEKNTEQTYKTGLRRFPQAGVLYSNYGEFLMPNRLKEALLLWQTGVRLAPEYGGNYYFLSKYLAANNDHLWAILYAETFINIESYTDRTLEIKNLLLEQYRKLFAEEAFTDKAFPADHFINKVGQNLKLQKQFSNYGITPESLMAIRIRFLLDYFSSPKPAYHLFNYQRQLLKDGFFEAYNQWLFGAASSLLKFSAWSQTNAKQLNDYLEFIKGRTYKILGAQQILRN